MINKGKMETISGGKIQNYNSSKFYFGYSNIKYNDLSTTLTMLVSIKGNKTFGRNFNGEVTFDITSDGKLYKNISDSTSSSFCVSFDKQPF